MITEYVQKALEDAQYKRLEDDTWFAEIPGFSGVWANAQTVETCRRDLSEVLEEWLLLKIRDGDQVPDLGNASLRIGELAEP